MPLGCKLSYFFSVSIFSWNSRLTKDCWEICALRSCNYKYSYQHRSVCSLLSSSTLINICFPSVRSINFVMLFYSQSLNSWAHKLQGKPGLVYKRFVSWDWGKQLRDSIVPGAKYSIQEGIFYSIPFSLWLVCSMSFSSYDYLPSLNFSCWMQLRGWVFCLYWGHKLSPGSQSDFLNCPFKKRNLLLLPWWVSLSVNQMFHKRKMAIPLDFGLLKI